MSYSAMLAQMGVFSRGACGGGRRASARLAYYVKRGVLLRIDSTHFAYVRRDGYGRIIPYEPFFTACRLGEGGMLSHASALQYYGYLPLDTATVYVTCTKRRPPVCFGGSRFVFCADDAEGGVREDTARRIRVTSLERTVIDCIATLKDPQALSDLVAVLQMAEQLHEGLLRKRLLQYDSSFVYQKTGMLLGRFAKARLSADFYRLCHGRIRCARDIFGGKKPPAHELDGYWRLYMPLCVRPTPDLMPPDLQELCTQEKEQPELLFFDKNFDVFHQTDMWMATP